MINEQLLHIDYTDKVVFITGSSKGIGRHLAQAFAENNARVIMTYCQSKESAVEFLSSTDKRSLYSLYKLDVTKTSDIYTLYDKIIRKFGKIDVLINNAGACDDNSIWDMGFDQWSRIIDINLTGVFLCSKVFSEIMKNQNYGKIINISSFIGQVGNENQINYSTSKGGVIGLTKSLAKGLGKYNILVNAVSPGFILTDLNKDSPHKRENAKRISVTDNQYSLNDLINFVLFLSSNYVQGVSGQVFNFDSRLI